MLQSQEKYQQRVNELLKNITQKDAKLTQRLKKHFFSNLSQFHQQLQKKKQCSSKLQCEVQNQEQSYQFDMQIKSAQHMGSLSNQVYKVQMKNGSILILKHYLEVLKQFVQRHFQHLILNKMTELKEYPFIFYKDDNCRIEQYVNGSSINRQSLTPKLLKKIVQRLARFSITYKNVIQNQSGANNRQIQNLFKTFRQIYELKRKQNPNLITEVQTYVNEVLQNKQILQNLKQLLKNQMIILSHNDSNLSNILLKQTNTIQLLDYQFVNYNYVGYDLGNLLNQIATDYGGAYDNGQHQHQSKFQIRKDWEIQKDLVKQITNLYFDIIQSVSTKQVKTQFKQRQRSVKIGRLLSHLYWLFIGVKQIDDPNIDLDMVYYVKRRYQEFMSLYKQMIQK